MRGTPEAYIKSDKQNDTLYFISEQDSNEGVLYLGNKVIGGSSTIDFNNFSIDALKDVLITESLTDKSLLIYSIKDKNWINADFSDLTFIGATQHSSGVSGFVPAPKEGEVNLFLRSDGNWVPISASGSHSDVNVDHLSVDIYNNQIILKNYGLKYYKYNQEKNDYEIQIVDAENPWKENLEPKVVNENGQLVLGWFESIDNIEINNIKNSIDTIKNLIGVKGDLEVPSTGIFADLDLKANKDSVFTKVEVENKIQSAISDVDHLKRVIVSSIEDIDINAKNSAHNIYLIASGLSDESNKYYEYMVVENSITGEKEIEKIGSWSVDLADYAKKDDILIKSVNDNFQVINGKLFLNTITIAEVKDLESLLSEKLSLSKAEEIFVSQTNFNSSVGDLDKLIKKNTDDIEFLTNCLTWQELNSN